MGDPVYDEQKNVIGRDFGVKNIVAIMVVGFIGYSLMGEMKPISGKRKMKGSGIFSKKPREFQNMVFIMGWITIYMIAGYIATMIIDAIFPGFATIKSYLVTSLCASVFIELIIVALNKQWSWM